MAEKDQPLKVELNGDTLSISIGVSALSAAVLARYRADVLDRGDVAIPDAYSLACQTVVELRRPHDRECLALLWLISTAERCSGIERKRVDPRATEGA